MKHTPPVLERQSSGGRLGCGRNVVTLGMVPETTPCVDWCSELDWADAPKPTWSCWSTAGRPSLLQSTPVTVIVGVPRVDVQPSLEGRHKFEMHLLAAINLLRQNASSLAARHGGQVVMSLGQHTEPILALGGGEVINCHVCTDVQLSMRERLRSTRLLGAQPGTSARSVCPTTK